MDSALAFRPGNPANLHFSRFGPVFARFRRREGSHRVRTAISCRLPVSIPRDLPPGPEKWANMFADFWSDNILSIFGPFLKPSPWGALMEKEGTDNVKLDTQVMESNPGIRPRSHEESPEFPKSLPSSIRC